MSIARPVFVKPVSPISPTYFVYLDNDTMIIDLCTEHFLGVGLLIIIIISS